MKNLIVIASVLLASSFSFAYDKEKAAQFTSAAQTALTIAEVHLNAVPNLEQDVEALKAVSQSVDLGIYLILFQVEEKSRMRVSGIIELTIAIEKLEAFVYELNSKANILNRINMNVDRQEAINSLTTAVQQITQASNYLKYAIIEAEDY